MEEGTDEEGSTLWWAALGHSCLSQSGSISVYTWLSPAGKKEDTSDNIHYKNTVKSACENPMKTVSSAQAGLCAPQTWYRTDHRQRFPLSRKADLEECKHLHMCVFPMEEKTSQYDWNLNLLSAHNFPVLDRKKMLHRCFQLNEKSKPIKHLNTAFSGMLAEGSLMCNPSREWNKQLEMRRPIA